MQDSVILGVDAYIGVKNDIQKRKQKLGYK
jgi:hypothetical protein